MNTADELRATGYWVAPIRIDDAVVELLRQACDATVRQLLDSPVDSSSRVAVDADGVDYVRRVGALWTRSPVFAGFMLSTPMLQVAELSIGEPALPVNAQLVIKHPREQQGLNWHYDPDPPGKPRPCFDYVIAVYLESSTADNGALRVVEGSHLWSLAERSEWIRSRPEISDRPSEQDSIELSCASGTVCLHERGIIHGSPRNRTEGQRRTMYMHYRSERMLTEFRGAEYVGRLRRSISCVPPLGSAAQK
ncbi:phytanoyl-CoA dioxygenase family protein [Nocardia gipuzkoensis]